MIGNFRLCFQVPSPSPPCRTASVHLCLLSFKNSPSLSQSPLCDSHVYCHLSTPLQTSPPEIPSTQDLTLPIATWLQPKHSSSTLVPGSRPWGSVPLPTRVNPVPLTLRPRQLSKPVTGENSSVAVLKHDSLLTVVLLSHLDCAWHR